MVLVRPSGGGASTEETLTRAQAELRAAGFATVVVEARGDEPARETSLRADPTAIAVIAVLRTEGAPTAEVWVEDRLTGTIVSRGQVSGDPRGGAADVAIQAVELLRASLVEIEAKAMASRAAEPERPAAPRALPAPDARAGDRPAIGGLTLSAGGSLFVGASPASAHVAPTVSAALVHSVGLGGRLRWAGPGAGTDLDAPEGPVAWSPWMLTGGALYEAFAADVIVLRASADVGLLHVHARGELDPPAQSREGNALDAAFLGGGAVGVFLTPAVALTLGAEILVAAPPPVVRVGGREVATVGRPWLFFPLAIEARL